MFGPAPHACLRFRSVGHEAATGRRETPPAIDSSHRAQQGFEAAGIAHGDVIDLTDAGLSILSFSDPDGIHLELTALLG